MRTPMLLPANALIRPRLAVLTRPFWMKTLPVNAAMAASFNRAIFLASMGVLEFLDRHQRTQVNIRAGNVASGWGGAEAVREWEAR